MSLTHRAVDIGSVVIALNGQNSTVLDFRGWRSGAKSITIFGPGTLTGTVKVQVAQDYDGSTATWCDLESAGSDVTCPADGATVIQAVGFNALRLASSAMEGAARTFKLMGEEGN